MISHEKKSVSSLRDSVTTLRSSSSVQGTCVCAQQLGVCPVPCTPGILDKIQRALRDTWRAAACFGLLSVLQTPPSLPHSRL